MNNLEDRLREGLHAPTDDMVAESMLARVRSGARRRRQRRTAAIVTASVAVVAAGLVSVGLIERDDGTLQPAPSTTPAGVIDLAVPNADHLFALSSDQGSTVWLRKSDGTWQRLHDFEQPVEYVEFAPDARNGWAWGSGLWSTHDSGRTWTQIETGPGAPSEYGHWVAITSTHAWASFVAGDLRPGLWRTDVGTDQWTRIGPAQVSSADLEAVGDRLVAIDYGEDTASPRMITSSDGVDWTSLDLPCRGENDIYVADNMVFLLCEATGGATVYRSSSLTAWEEFGHSDLSAVSAVLPLGDDRLLLVGKPHDLLVTSAGNQVVDIGLRGGEEIFQRTFGTAGDTTYAVTSEHRILVSNDAGENWSALD